MPKIISEIWIENILEFKNKEYGAYLIRKEANKNQTIALGIANSIFISLFLLYWLFLSLDIKPKNKKVMTLMNSNQLTEIKDTTYIEKTEDLRIVELEISKIDFLNIQEDEEVDRLYNKKREAEIAKSNIIFEGGVIKYSIDPKTGKKFNPKQNAEFPGGVNEFTKHLLSKIKFNKLVKNDSNHYENGDDEIDIEINTLVFIKCEINEQGKLENIEIFKGSSDPKFNDRIIEAFKSSPDWYPAKNKGKYISQTLIIPFHFNYSQPLVKYYFFDGL